MPYPLAVNSAGRWAGRLVGVVCVSLPNAAQLILFQYALYLMNTYLPGRYRVLPVLPAAAPTSLPVHRLCRFCPDPVPGQTCLAPPCLAARLPACQQCCTCRLQHRALWMDRSLAHATCPYHQPLNGRYAPPCLRRLQRCRCWLVAVGISPYLAPCLPAVIFASDAAPPCPNTPPALGLLIAVVIAGYLATQPGDQCLFVGMNRRVWVYVASTLALTPSPLYPPCPRRCRVPTFLAPCSLPLPRLACLPYPLRSGPPCPLAPLPQPWFRMECPSPAAGLPDGRMNVACVTLPVVRSAVSDIRWMIRCLLVEHRPYVLLPAPTPFASAPCLATSAVVAVGYRAGDRPLACPVAPSACLAFPLHDFTRTGDLPRALPAPLRLGVGRCVTLFVMPLAPLPCLAPNLVWWWCG